jgi:hypothetical protein
MSIDPTSPSGPQRPLDPAALDAAGTPRPAPGSMPPAGGRERERPSVPEHGVRADSLDLSEAARNLAREIRGREVHVGLPPERLREIVRRLASGFYDRPEIIEEVARRLARDPDGRAE